MSFALVETTPAASAAQFELRLSSSEVLHISVRIPAKGNADSEANVLCIHHQPGIPFTLLR